MNNDTLACGLYQLEHAAMCDNSSAAAVLAHIKRLKAQVATLTVAYEKLLTLGINDRRLLTQQLKTEDALRIEIERLKADMAQLREMYADRDSDLAFEFERANKLEAYLEEAASAAASGADPMDYLATKAPTTLRDEIARLTAEVERLTDAWLQYETIQPNGELGASVGDVLAENEMYRRISVKLQAEVERLTALADVQADSDTAMLDNVEPMLQTALALAEMQTAEVERLRDELAALSADNERLRHALTWHHCDTHGDVGRFAWGCPECVRELRAEVARLIVAQSQPAILRLPRKCSECERWDDWVDDESTDGIDDDEAPSTPGSYKQARGVLHRGHDAELPEDVIRRSRDEDGDARPDGTIQYSIRARTHEHVMGGTA